MDQASGNDAKPVNQEAEKKKTDRSWHLAKWLLTKFDSLHEFHVQQMEAYTYACSHMIVYSEFNVNTDKRIVTYRMKSEREYIKEGNEFVNRKWYSPTKLKYTFSYKQETAKAAKLLKTWTQRLLWDNHTKVEVWIDDKQVL